MATGGTSSSYGYTSSPPLRERLELSLAKVNVTWKEMFSAAESDSERCLVCDEVKSVTLRRHILAELGYICSDACLYNSWYSVLEILKNKGL